MITEQSHDRTIHIIQTKNGEEFEIPEEGSLGLLALGYVGLMLWRQKKNEVMTQNKSGENNASSYK